MNKFVWILVSIPFILLVSCDIETLEPIDPSIKNNVSLEFEHRVDTQRLILNNQAYQNSSGESFKVSKLNYFISNISFKNTSGQVITLADQYFLIKEEIPNTLIPVVKDVPTGDYTEVSFVIGVDSLKSISPIEQRIGVLDPASYNSDNMYWSWNSGYIFFKMEGISSAAPLNTAGENKFQYHIGGFGGRTAVTANNIRKVSMVLPEVLKIRKSNLPSVHFIANLSQVFTGAQTIKIANAAVVMNPTAGLPISANYAKMFSVDHIHN